MNIKNNKTSFKLSSRVKPRDLEDLSTRKELGRDDKVKMKTIKAFTLVEFAVVITIMGLLIGGTLAGIDIIRTAKVTATIAQIDNYNAAVNAFYKTYGALPGDMPNADTRLPDCIGDGDFQGCKLDKVGGNIDTATCYLGYVYKYKVGLNWVYAYGIDEYDCNLQDYIDICGDPEIKNYDDVEDDLVTEKNNKVETSVCFKTVVSKATTATGQVGDGAVGPVSWDMLTYRGEDVIGNSLSADNAIDAETLLFWYELQKAGLVSGVTDAGLRKSIAKPSFGKAYPYAELGGGFWAGYSDGCCGIKTLASSLDSGRPTAAGNFNLNGNLLILLKYPTGSRQKVTGTQTIYSCQGEGDEYTCDSFPVENFLLNVDTYDNIINPKEAADIDRKLDDGFSNTGTIQAYGEEAYCYKNEGNSFVYDESVSIPACGLYIKIRE